MTLAGFTILHVEDDADDAFFMQAAWRRAGMPDAIRAVKNGEAAMDYLEGTGSFGDRGLNPLPALILLDLKLPRKSGLEFLSWLRGKPGLRRIPVVVMTSSALAKDIDSAYDLGANAYLVKPVEAAELQEAVNTIRAFWIVLNNGPASLNAL
jgi:CheY-like chemotaxis protein